MGAWFVKPAVTQNAVNMKFSDIIDYWKNGTDTFEKIMYTLLILSVLCMGVGIIGGIIIDMNHV